MQQSDQELPQRFDRAKPWRSEAYLAYVRSRPCVVTGSEHEGVIAHHVRCLGGGGMGLKPPDWLCLPLDSHEHTTLHSVGEASYWRERGVDPMEMICMTLLVYLSRYPSAQTVSALADVVTNLPR